MILFSDITVQTKLLVQRTDQRLPGPVVEDAYMLKKKKRLQGWLHDCICSVRKHIILSLRLIFTYVVIMYYSFKDYEKTNAGIHIVEVVL